MEQVSDFLVVSMRYLSWTMVGVFLVTSSLAGPDIIYHFCLEPILSDGRRLSSDGDSAARPIDCSSRHCVEKLPKLFDGGKGCFSHGWSKQFYAPRGQVTSTAIDSLKKVIEEGQLSRLAVGAKGNRAQQRLGTIQGWINPPSC